MAVQRCISSDCRLVIFDLDGTLTKPLLDFDQLRAEIGLEAEPILEAVEKMMPPHRDRAEAILQRHEAAAAIDSELQPGAAGVVAAIRSAGIPVALMTRNSSQSVATFQAKHEIQFDLVWTREDGPTKPSPEPVFEICRRLDVPPGQAVVIGDFHYDILCGQAAGCTTVLLLDGQRQRPDWADEADFVIGELTELLTLLGLGPSDGVQRR